MVSYFFRRHSTDLALGPESVGPAGLRAAQAGAAWAVVAHATRSEVDVPAQIVLPTGAGKTAVLTLLPFLLRSRRVLVIAPSRLIRRQLADAFLTFKDLRNAGIIGDSVGQPNVVVVERRATEGDWLAWADADVVVATVHSVSHGYPGVKRLPSDLFDLALFDEAHHVPANAWTALLDQAKARSVLATATPFRTDLRPLPGDEVYRYPLRRAISEKILAPVKFVPVAMPADGDKNAALARTAAGRIRSSEHVAAGSRMLVRTNRVDAAEELVELYAIEGIRLGLITGSTSESATRSTLGQVRRGELDGFACVGALIEGFDFPELKIAAYHEPHRTLGATL